MWSLVPLLLVCATIAAKKSDHKADKQVPQYVQSRASFGHIRLFLQENIPNEERDIADPVMRQHLAFAIIVHVTAKIAEDYRPLCQNYVFDPIKILYDEIPNGWEHYNNVSRDTNQFLAEVHAKVQPISNLIDVLCSTTQTTESCNLVVNDKVNKSDVYIQARAKFLLLLGDVSEKIKKHEGELIFASKSFDVVPYLLRQVQTKSYKSFIETVSKVYHMMQDNPAKPVECKN